MAFVTMDPVPMIALMLYGVVSFFLGRWVVTRLLETNPKPIGYVTLPPTWEDIQLQRIERIRLGAIHIVGGIAGADRSGKGNDFFFLQAWELSELLDNHARDKREKVYEDREVSRRMTSPYDREKACP